MTSERWWNAEHHKARRARLLSRGRAQTGLREWFAGEGFVEVDTAALQVSPGNEVHLHALRTGLSDGEAEWPRYLRTSPEFAAKKLLGAGETRIFEFAKVFRNRERSPINVPEFTMLEWYRTDATLDRAMQDAVAIARLAATYCGADALTHRGVATDPFAEPERIGVAEAFSRHAGIDLLATLDRDGAPLGGLLKNAAAEIGIRVQKSDSWSDVFSRVMAERVEPHLGRERLTLLTDYPAPESALARLNPHDRRIAERFELFAGGVELANGFGELTDPKEQRKRFEAAMAAKERVYGERYPVDEDFLEALASMPPAVGVALGFDRLVMLATGADSVAEVQWTPVVLPDA